jgi:hypothetical protein
MRKRVVTTWREFKLFVCHGRIQICVRVSSVVGTGVWNRRKAHDNRVCRLARPTQVVRSSVMCADRCVNASLCAIWSTRIRRRPCAKSCISWAGYARSHTGSLMCVFLHRHALTVSMPASTRVSSATMCVWHTCAHLSTRPVDSSSTMHSVT